MSYRTLFTLYAYWLVASSTAMINMASSILVLIGTSKSSMFYVLVHVVKVEKIQSEPIVQLYFDAKFA